MSISRKFSVTALLLLLLAGFVFANNQKYYPVSSEEWQAVNDICHYAGVAGPTSFGPVPTGELIIALDRAEKRIGSNTLVSWIRERLEDESALVGHSDDLGYVNLKGQFSPEMYAQTASTTYDNLKYSDGFWIIKNYRSRNPLLSITIESGIQDNVYGKFVMIGKQKQYVGDTWDKNFSMNIPNGMASNFPFEAGISLGGKGFNFIIARDKVSLGEGKTGNTAIGDVFNYQEFLRGGFYSRIFSFHLNLTNFDSARGKGTPFVLNNGSFSGWKQIRHAVNYEIVLLDKIKVNAALIAMLDTDSGFDIRLINPFMVMHSMFNFHESTILEANNMISLDVSYAFAPKWNAYLQVSMDQFQVTGEASGYEEEFGYTDPNALGGLFNLSYTDILDKALFTAYVEAVCNMPGMYLNQKFYDANGNVTQKKTANQCWSQDYLVGYARNNENADEVTFSGYTYGPDCVVVALGVDYLKNEEYWVKTRLQYLAHGEKGRGTDSSNYDFSDIDLEDTMNRMPLKDEAVEHTVSCTLEGEYSFRDWVSVYAGIGLAYRINENFSGDNGFNAQFALGATVKLP